jgi:hypothetical protein
MAKRTYEDRMKLNMSFGEALERYAGTSPKEMHANIKRAKKKKPPGGKKHKPSGGSSQAENVVSLKVRRVRKRNTGR